MQCVGSKAHVLSPQFTVIRQDLWALKSNELVPSADIKEDNLTMGSKDDDLREAAAGPLSHQALPLYYTLYYIRGVAAQGHKEATPIDFR